jgi:superfamily II DNA or RNA helicase
MPLMMIGIYDWALIVDHQEKTACIASHLINKDTKDYLTTLTKKLKSVKPNNQLFKINSNYMLGLSATPERKDNMTKVLNWHLGNIINIQYIVHKLYINVKRYFLNNIYEKIIEDNSIKNEFYISNKITSV